MPPRLVGRRHAPSRRDHALTVPRRPAPSRNRLQINAVRPLLARQRACPIGRCRPRRTHRNQLQAAHTPSTALPQNTHPFIATNIFMYHAGAKSCVRARPCKHEYTRTNARTHELWVRKRIRMHGLARTAVDLDVYIYACVRARACARVRARARVCVRACSCACV